MATGWTPRSLPVRRRRWGYVTFSPAPIIKVNLSWGAEAGALSASSSEMHGTML